MERNYDEFIADMMKKIDRQGDRLDKHWKQLEKHNLVLDKHSRELTRQSRRSEKFYKELSDWMRDLKAIQDNHLELIVNTANRLHIVITKNNLKI